MKCIIPGVNIKVFGRAIHSLSRIGEELYIEPLEHGLALRTVNSSRSAYGCFLFSPTFFQHYDDGSGELNSQDSEEEALRCKIAMKSILTVFKSMSTIEKTVERCQIKLNMKEARLVFQLYCKHGIVKTHNLAFIECETLQAVFSKEQCVNSLTAQAKLLCDAVVNFQTNQEEITLIVAPDKISLKNYVEEEPDPNKVMHTVLNLDPDEFINCQIGVDSEITFCLKELRAILGFAEVIGIPLSLHFETAGKPIVLSIDHDAAFEGSFVLATLADSQSQGSCSQQPSQSRMQNKNSTRDISVDRSSRTEKTPMNKRSEMDYSNIERARSSHGYRSESSKDRQQRLQAAYTDLMEDDFDDDMMLTDLDNNTSSKALSKQRSSLFRSGRNSPQPSTSKDHSESPIIPVQSVKPQSLNISMVDDVVAEDEDDVIPGTPPQKKFRSMFFGSSQASTCSQVSNFANRNPATVLAEDTDEED